jgi:glycosyltransferase involved in cell wall biosynthesis
MKLIIQIPCLDEEETLPATLGDLPREVPGFDVVEWLVIDDGSTDRTVEVARANGVDHIVRLTNNKGLAAAFQAGLDASLKLGADVVVNTLETIIQAGKLLVATDHVSIATNPQTRDSRLFPSMGSYVRRNAVAIARIYAQYEPLKVFLSLAGLLFLLALVPFGRFTIAYIAGDGAGHVQSLIFGAVLFNAAVVLAALGVIGDLLYGQRIMSQRIFERVRRIELQLAVPPSHYEPGSHPTGQPATTGAQAGQQRTEDREALQL